MEGVSTPVRVAAYAEHEEKKDGREEIHWMWAATTSKEIDYRTIWKIMHKRWDIEENAFHQLKTYDHAKHCYGHEGMDAIFILMIMAFN